MAVSSLTIRTIDGQNKTISVFPEMTIRDLKEKIAGEFPNFSVASQRLIYRGTVLEDLKTLAEHAVSDGHVVHLVQQAPSSQQQQQQQQQAPGGPPSPHHPGASAATVLIGSFPVSASLAMDPASVTHNILEHVISSGGLGPQAALQQVQGSGFSPAAVPLSVSAVSSLMSAQEESIELAYRLRRVRSLLTQAFLDIAQYRSLVTGSSGSSNGESPVQNEPGPSPAATTGLSLAAIYQDLQKLLRDLADLLREQAGCISAGEQLRERELWRNNQLRLVIARSLQCLHMVTGEVQALGVDLGTAPPHAVRPTNLSTPAGPAPGTQHLAGLPPVVLTSVDMSVAESGILHDLRSVGRPGPGPAPSRPEGPQGSTQPGLDASGGLMSRLLSAMFGREEPEAPRPTPHQPGVNPAVNPGVNPAVNPTVNPGVNPAVNPGVNPAVNPTVNPAVNPGVNRGSTVSASSGGREQPCGTAVDSQPKGEAKNEKGSKSQVQDASCKQASRPPVARQLPPVEEGGRQWPAGMPRDWVAVLQHDCRVLTGAAPLPQAPPADQHTEAGTAKKRKVSATVLPAKEMMGRVVQTSLDRVQVSYSNSSLSSHAIANEAASNDELVEAFQEEMQSLLRKN